MKEIKKLYTESFREHGDSHKAVQWPKGRQFERFAALTANIRHAGGFSVLDFGCGLAHMKEFLDSHFSNVEYTGVDLVDDFLEHNKKKYPECVFMTPENFQSSNVHYDYVLASGVFNILYSSSVSEHSAMVRKIMLNLFSRTRKYMASDFMTDRVDFKQQSTFHASPEEMFRMFSTDFSRRIIIDHSYLPYEFCVTVFKSDNILRPDNIYGAI